MIGWLAGEEMMLLLGAAAALGCLALGILDLLWPARPRRTARPPAAAVRRISAEWLVGLVERTRAETDPERRSAALRVAILTLERWRASLAVPDDAVSRALDRARAELWADYQRLTYRRLAPTAPWQVTPRRVGER